MYFSFRVNNSLLVYLVFKNQMIKGKTPIKIVKNQKIYNLINRDLHEVIDKKKDDKKINEVLKRYDLPSIEEIRDNNLYLIITSYNWSEIDLHSQELHPSVWNFILELRKWKRIK